MHGHHSMNETQSIPTFAEQAALKSAAKTPYAIAVKCKNNAYAHGAKSQKF